MRITHRMMVDNAIQNMSENLEKVSKLQGKLSTGKQFQVASEDPARASVSLSLKSNLRTLESYADTAETAKNWMTVTDNALGELGDIGIRAMHLILRGINDTFSGSERAATMAVEMQDLLNQAVELGNTSVNDQYIFAGYQVNAKAFELVASATALLDYQGNPFTPKVVNYLGDAGVMQRTLGPDQSVALNVRGDQAINGLLQNLILATNALKQNDTVSLQNILTNLRSSLDIMDQYRASNGARLRQAESAADFLETMKIETQSLLSRNEDINMAEGISLLANQQTTYEAVLEVSRRAVSALSLFDYLK
ncbi:flagellar hook-associated protein 3 [Chloroflexi bacterium CFX6]|nr:flagellar hook-associated protein 3 [Chloroflexi bacterium CFX6]